MCRLETPCKALRRDVHAHSSPQSTYERVCLCDKETLHLCYTEKIFKGQGLRWNVVSPRFDDVKWKWQVQERLLLSRLLRHFSHTNVNTGTELIARAVGGAIMWSDCTRYCKRWWLAPASRLARFAALVEGKPSAKDVPDRECLLPPLCAHATDEPVSTCLKL